MAVTPGVRIKVVQTFYSSNSSVTRTRRRLLTEQGIDLSDSIIRSVVKRFEKNGSTSRPKRVATPRRRTVRTPAAVRQVQSSVLQEPKLSLNRRSNRLGISRSTTQRILKQDIEHKAFRYI